MVYEQRYRFDPKTVLLLVFAGAIVAGALLAPHLSISARTGLVLFFGAGGLLGLVTSLSRRVALRVDADGITFGGTLLRYRASTRRFPWADVEAVVLWRQQTAAGVPWIGILRHRYAPPLPGALTGAGGRGLTTAFTALIGAPDERLLECAKGIDGWSLDTARLATVLGSVAPGVRFVDHR
ncbi:hypothetical protein [Nocardia sp. alder85J]|uniref:hypothetical protein n=1 Tax=Nocardia sp. alder85J TaxID=2862949 RepID=UPI001CD37283|nr:hypothetical protein [Nocardia sp. alder85J]MCX4094626.1 hypothetical protein [Nocardia sp. alder85J]